MIFKESTKEMAVLDGWDVVSSTVCRECASFRRLTVADVLTMSHSLGSSDGQGFSSFAEAFAVWILDGVKWGWCASPPTWTSTFIAATIICFIGAPVLLVGLTRSGCFSAYILCCILWRAFGGQGVSIVAVYFLLGTAATKVKLKQKQAEGTAEKRSGRRGPASVWGSSLAGVVCALGSIYEVGGPQFTSLWRLGFLASFCTKLSDTTSSEIGKAYGENTYLVTSLCVVPRGTEGAVSIEGTLAGLVASVLLAAIAYALNQVDVRGVLLCVVASQIANLCESYLGATLQGQDGFKWLSNDMVNIANISVGAFLAICSRSFMNSFSAAAHT